MLSTIEKAKNRDPVALTLLINTYKDKAYNLALSIVRQPEDAKDVTQQSFLLVLEHIGKFRNEARFSTWLYKIVYNESIRWKKKNSVIKPFEDMPGLRYETTDKFDIQARNELIDQALRQLKETERVVISLFYLGEKSLREIALITGLSMINTKVILYRARKKIKSELNYEYFKAS